MALPRPTAFMVLGVRGIGAFGAVAVCAAALVAAAPAAAVPRCDGASDPKPLLGGQGLLESVIFDEGGRLIFTATPDDEDGRLMVLPKWGARAKVLSEPIKSPGGLALDDHGQIIVGFGNGLNGLTGTVFATAGLFRVNARTGHRTVFTEGLSQANGVARGLDGTYYASADFGTDIDRIMNGQVERGWIKTVSPNGLVVSRDGRRLYWAQTLQPPQISYVDLANPGQPRVYARGNPSDLTAGLDGMVGDSRDRLFVAANLSGEVWRVDRTARVCQVTKGLNQPSAVALGSGKHGFKRSSLFAVDFGGRVWEVKKARAARYPAD